jgi:hypothetical protein
LRQLRRLLLSTAALTHALLRHPLLLHHLHQVLGMAYEFYEGQMSGNLPSWNRLLYSKGGWKKSAHLNDGSPIGKDLSGGYYDAGGGCVCMWLVDTRGL